MGQWAREGVEQRWAAIERAEARGDYFGSGEVFGDTAMNACMAGRGGFDLIRGGLSLSSSLRANGLGLTLRTMAFETRYWATTYDGIGFRAVPSVEVNELRGSMAADYATCRAVRTVAKETYAAERALDAGEGTDLPSVRFYQRAQGTRVEAAARGTAINRLVDQAQDGADNALGLEVQAAKHPASVVLEPLTGTKVIPPQPPVTLAPVMVTAEDEKKR